MTLKYAVRGYNKCQCETQELLDAVRNLPHVHQADFNAVSGLLCVAFKGDQLNVDDLKKSIIDAVKHIDNDLSLIEKTLQSGKKVFLVQYILFFSGVLSLLIAFVLRLPFWLEFSFYLISYLLIGGKVLIKAVINISKGRVFNEYFLMSIATAGAFLIREFPEAVAVMLFYRVGEFLQEGAINRSKRSIAALMDLRPDHANLEINGVIKRVLPQDVHIGDIILIKPGEKVPLDGFVIEGKASLDVSSLTGETMPVLAEAGREVFSGSVNTNGLIKIRVAKEYRDSAVSRILDLVQNASEKKARTENFMTRFAKYYTPAVVLSALLLAVLPPLFFTGEDFLIWLYRGLVLLVISCPCALVISIPLGFFGGIGGASRKGILIKGSNYLEALSRVDTVVFDKTGTLTKGIFEVKKIMPVRGMTKERLLELSAYAESRSNHPVSKAVVKAFGKPISDAAVTGYEEIAGQGINAIVSGNRINIGNERFMQNKKVRIDPQNITGTVLYVAIDGGYAGCIALSDTINKGSISAIQELKKYGVRRIVMLTGDKKENAESIGKELKLNEVYAELLPEQKVDILDKLELQKGKRRGSLIFVGDGINDAPALARADVGVAMGAIGSDAAIEAADVVLMTDEPLKLVSAIRIAKRTHAVVWQNIIFALLVKGVVMLLGAAGHATLWAAVFADVGVALLAVFNALRAYSMRDA